MLIFMYAYTNINHYHLLQYKGKVYHLFFLDDMQSPVIEVFSHMSWHSDDPELFFISLKNYKNVGIIIKEK